jgi:Tripartite tricarboxylate transporter family receptor
LQQLAIVAALLVGANLPFFGDVVTNIMALVKSLGDAGLVGPGVNYDPVKDFVPITRVGSFTLMLVVNPNLPIHSVKEMIDYVLVQIRIGGERRVRCHQQRADGALAALYVHHQPADGYTLTARRDPSLSG